MNIEEIRALKPRRYNKTYVVHNVQPGTVPPKINEFILTDDARVYQMENSILHNIGEYYFVAETTLVMNVSPIK